MRMEKIDIWSGCVVCAAASSFPLYGSGRDARVASRVQGKARVAPRITTHCENYADEDGERGNLFFCERKDEDEYSNGLRHLLLRGLSG